MPPRRKPEKRKDASALVGGPGAVSQPKPRKGRLQEPKVVRAKWRETLIASHADPFDILRSPARCQGIVVALAGDVGVRPCLEPHVDGTFCAVCGRAPERQARLKRLLRDGWEEILMADLVARAAPRGRSALTYKKLAKVEHPEKRGKRVAKELAAAIPVPEPVAERGPLVRPVPSWRKLGR